MDRRDFVLTAALGAAGVGLVSRWAAAQDEVTRRYLHCYTHRLDMERGFKFHCLTPQDTELVFGKHEYAGFFTVRVGEAPWLFVGDTPPEHERIPSTLEDLTAGTFSLVRQTPGARVEQSVQWNALYPATWLSASGTAATGGTVTGALMGWSWADRLAPTRWLAAVGALTREPGQTLQLPQGAEWIGYHDEHGPFTGLLAFAGAPERVWVDDDGVYWEWGRAEPGRDFATSPVAYCLAPSELPAESLAALAPLLARPPDSCATGVAEREGEPEWLILADADAAPVPPSLSSLARDRAGAIALPTVAGELLVQPGGNHALRLPRPPEYPAPVPALTPPPAVAEEVARLVADVLAHRLPDGRFPFSEGRTFYDGITCGCLAQVLPILPEPLRAETSAALRQCLDALCEGHVRSPAYNLLVPPEVPSFIETGIDYPEITATLLYAILAYSIHAEADYAARRVDLIETHLNQIAQMVTPEGLSWARADTNNLHVIAESAIGGYLAWCSLYHLGQRLGKPWGWCRSQAALTWAARRELFGWRPEFGDVNALNGWSDWCADCKRPEPWAYVQSTWFSYTPFMAYEQEDRYNLWRCLREQPWWDYTGPEVNSRQRGYDYANMLALAKAGFTDEVREHFAEVHARPFWYDYFDATPVMAIAALPQLAAMGVTA
jgi:hypothetical protein